MYTDMVGYTALGQRNESLSLALVEEQRKLIRPILTKHRGREIKTIGDAFLVEFSNALDAVRCAYDIQRGTRELNVSLPPESRIHLRVGLHLGDVVESHGDISGDAVNVASRIDSLAEDGGVCLTRQVYDQVANKFELPLSSLGPKTLKNVSEPLEVFRVAMPWSEGKVAQPQLFDKKRIAILPFASMSPDPNDEYFADGMTEELISTTSSITGLTLIARTSVMGYKGSDKKVEVIGRELSVGTVLEGSVRKAGNKLRITVQMIDVESQGHLWAQSYDRDFDDVFAVQSDIAKRVAKALRVRMLPHEVRQLEKKPTENTEAYALYLRAMQLYNEGTEHGTREAVDLLNQAVSKDPTFARAYAGLSQAWGLLGNWEDLEVVRSKAEAAVRKALDLDPSSAEAHAAMAGIYFAHDRFDHAIAEAKKAIELKPSLAEAHLALSNWYSIVGNLDQALASSQKALELDPLSFFAGIAVAEVLGEKGKIQDGMAVLERMKEVHPNNVWIYDNLAFLSIWNRDYARAQEILDKVLLEKAIDPKDDPWLLIDQGLLYALTGRGKEAQDLFAETQRDRVESNRLLAKLYIQTALGNLDEAFEALWRQAETHSWSSLVINDPLFKELRKDPRYLEFCAKVGVPPPTSNHNS
jgi:adenylate cyclase